MTKHRFHETSVFDARSITVGLLPLAHARPPPREWRYYQSLMQANCEVDMASLTLAAATQAKAPVPTAFARRRWDRAKIVFDFCETNQLASEWDALHVNKRIMAVIALIHCPSVQDDPRGIHKAYQEFCRVRDQCRKEQAKVQAKGGSGTATSGPLQFLAFAFHIGDAQVAPEHPDLIVFPNQTESHLCFYLSTCLSELAMALLRDFETATGTAGIPIDAELQTPLADRRTRTKTEVEVIATAAAAAASHAATFPPASPAGSSSWLFRNQDNTPKVRAATTARRREKYRGDLSLLAGSPLDAIHRYQSVIDALKQHADWVWHASALEGLAAALIAVNEERVPRKDGAVLPPSLTTLAADVPAPSFLDRVRDLYREALESYQKAPSTTFLSVEAALKLARYLVRWERVDEALDMLRHVDTLCADVSAHDQIAVHVEIAVLCARVGALRKCGFYLRHVASLYSELRMFSPPRHPRRHR